MLSHSFGLHRVDRKSIILFWLGLIELQSNVAITQWTCHQQAPAILRLLWLLLLCTVKKNLSQRCSANMFNGTSVSVYFEWTTKDKTFKWMHNLYHVFSVLSSWSLIAMIKFFPHRMRYGKIQTTLMLLENS